MAAARHRPPRLQARMAALLVLLALVAVVLVGRLGQWQVTDHPVTEPVAGPDTATVMVPAQRGRILDRDGVALADIAVRTDVTIDRAVLADQPDQGRAVVARVAGALSLPVDDLWGRTTLCGAPGAAPRPVCWPGSALVPIPVASDVDPAVAVTLTETPERYPGTRVSATAVRSYPKVAMGGGAAQTLGHLTPASAETAAESAGAVAEGDLVGSSGLEQEYQDRLAGTPGQSVVRVDARGVAVEELSSTLPEAGQDIVTTLDVRIQRAAEDALTEEMAAARGRGAPATSGGALVMDLRDGAVLASASAPTYDPTVWIDGVDQSDFDRLTTGDDSPLIDRVAGVARPPASTFKAVTLPGAVAAGVDLDDSVDCTANHRVGGRLFNNFESRAYGRISWHRAMVVSCDTVFYRVADEVWREQGGLAATTDADDPLIAVARSLGLGERTGVDLPGESPGRIPGREWKRENWEETKDASCQRAEAGYPEMADRSEAAYLTQLDRDHCATGYRFQPGDEANFSIGQGDVSATLLQMARVYGVIATDGQAVTPHLASAAIGPTGRREPLTHAAPRRLDLPGDSGANMRASMRAVVTEGTAASAFDGADLRGWPVAGKTGTAEVFGKEDTSWFISWGPSDDPRFVVAVAVDEGGTGGSTAAGIAREIHEALAARDLP